MGSTISLAFAVANCIFNLEKYNSKDISQYIYYTESELSPDIKKVFISLSNNKIIFKVFDQNFINKILEIDNKTFSQIITRYTVMYFSKFTIFEELQNYDNVLWLDADILIQSSIKQIFEYKGICWRPAIVPLIKKISLPFLDIRTTDTSPNGGVILVTKEIRKYNITFIQCIKLLSQLSQYTQRNSLDELTFAVIAKMNNLPISILPPTFNAGCSWLNSEKATIVHSIGKNKFWNYAPTYILFSKWKEGHQKWLELSGEKDNVSLQYEKFFGTTYRSMLTSLDYMCFWMSNLGNFYLPTDISMSTNFTKNYVQFYIKSLDKKIHYEFLLQKNKKLELHFHVENSKYIKNEFIEPLKELSSKYNFNFIKTEDKITLYKPIEIKNMQKEIISFINNTLSSILSLFIQK